jgi:hypothetical protein
MLTMALSVADAVVLSCCTALSRLQKTEEESRGLPTFVGSDLVENFHLQRNRRASDDPQDARRDKQAQEASSSSARLVVF